MDVTKLQSKTVNFLLTVPSASDHDQSGSRSVGDSSQYNFKVYEYKYMFMLYGTLSGPNNISQNVGSNFIICIFWKSILV